MVESVFDWPAPMYEVAEHCWMPWSLAKARWLTGFLRVPLDLVIDSWSVNEAVACVSRGQVEDARRIIKKYKLGFNDDAVEGVIKMLKPGADGMITYNSFVQVLRPKVPPTVSPQRPASGAATSSPQGLTPPGLFEHRRSILKMDVRISKGFALERLIL